MSFELVYTRRAAKDIQKLDAPTRKRIGKALLEFKDALLDLADKLMDLRIGSYRFRVGDYRIVFDLEGSDMLSFAWGIGEISTGNNRYRGNINK